MLGDPATHTEGLLGLVLKSMADGDLEGALRYADRARRMRPGDVEITQLCARILAQGGRPDLGLALMDGVAADGQWATRGLMRAQLLLAAGRADDAAEALDGLAGVFAVEALPGFGRLAADICAASEGRRQGWVGISSVGELVGGVHRGMVGRLADIVQTRGGKWSARELPGNFRQDPGLAAFHVSGTQALEDVARAMAESFGIIGARTVRWPPAWRFDGELTVDDDHVQGWVALGWAPDQPVPVIVSQAADHQTQVLPQAETDGNGAIRHVFSVARDRRWRGETPQVFALLPDGRRMPMADRSEPRVRMSPRPGTPATDISPRPTPRLSVIVPVYAGIEETLNCLRSVFDNTPLDNVDLIVVHDHGPEPELLEALRGLASQDRITLLINPRNLGFPASVNRGMAALPDNDVVLLNADAEVFGDWLARLTATAYARPDIATVTPFTNCGSILSYPAGEEADIETDSAARIDRILSRNPDRTLIDLPSAVGFCMYIKRACLGEVGVFDEESFGPGYGEENDFCLRASAAGWRHVAATNLFVRHAGGRSFGPLKALLMETNLRVLGRRFPDYVDLVGAFQRRDPLHPTRRWLDERRVTQDARPVTLMITPGRDGGVGRHLKDRQRDVLAAGGRVLELNPGADDADARPCRLTVVGESFGDLTYRLPLDLGPLLELLRQLPIQTVEIHHFVGLDPCALDIPVRLGVPYAVIVHDYSWVCPRITFIAGDPRYCGEPSLEACERCVVEHGSLIGEAISVAALRARSASLFEGAASVTVPCQDVASRLGRYVPGVPWRVTPWESSPPPPDLVRRGRPQRARVAVIGAIGEHKGYRHLLDCARDAAARDLDLEFVVIGYTEDDFPLFETGRVFVTGIFHDDEVADLIERERCNVALYLSVAPETWSYALTHGIRSGLPIIAFDFGALGERLKGLDRARLLPTDADASAVNETLIASARARFTLFLRAQDQEATAFDDDVWARLPRAGAWVEGFRLDLDDVLCRGILPGGLFTPWALSPGWCADPSGSRPLLGVALRLRGGLAVTHWLDYAAVFSSGATASAGREGEPCLSPHQNDPLVALRITLRPR